ncbi:MAG: hypothetical protein IPK44_16330 [Candidatus Accumulibacter sp.]|uniref:hypothetical protein n=1 Tax=Accumulibacter sp. TaxID=2053492 RepID=UPI00258CA4A2|nr:hypothetical protein [Accumulibacter sp.]MBK8115941.1 hypothetical protein [Accumulibacter sp.]
MSEGHYYEARHDLGAAFLEQCLRLTKLDGDRVGPVIQQSWLFAGSYGAYRRNYSRKAACIWLPTSAKARFFEY